VGFRFRLSSSWRDSLRHRSTARQIRALLAAAAILLVEISLGEFADPGSRVSWQARLDTSLPATVHALAVSLLARIRRVWTAPEVRLGLTAFLALRLLTAGWALVARQIVNEPFPPDPILRPFFSVQVEANPLLEPWQRWDTLHYQAIAERGYAAFEGALFAPPLYPLAMRLASTLVSGNTLLAGILVSNLACALAFIAFAHLALRELEPLRASRRSVLYLASFPASFFLVAAYTESLYLLAAILVLLHLRKQQWLRAGTWGAVACMTRLPGVVVLAPILFAVATTEKRAPRAWAGVVIASLGAVLFPLYVWATSGAAPWLPLIAQAQRFRGGFSFPGLNLVDAVRNLLAGEFVVADVLDLLALLLFMFLTFHVWRRLPRVYGVYYTAFLLLLLARRASVYPLIGTSRYVLALFPAFFVLAQFGEQPWIHRAILYTFWAGLLFMAGEFAIWGWIG